MKLKIAGMTPHGSSLYCIYSIENKPINVITGVKHIIFDLGGVLLNIDYKLTEQAFIDAGIPDFAHRYSQLKQTDVFDKLETGKISEEEFVMAMQAASQTCTTPQQVLAAWNAMLLVFPG